jgi:mRNA interferase HigB
LTPERDSPILDYAHHLEEGAAGLLGADPAAKGPLEAWHAEARSATWVTPAEVKAQYGTASVLKDGRVVFNIGGNKYRLVVWINYAFFTIYIRFVGTHSEYDEIDAQTI